MLTKIHRSIFFGAPLATVLLTCTLIGAVTFSANSCTDMQANHFESAAASGFGIYLANNHDVSDYVVDLSFPEGRFNFDPGCGAGYTGGMLKVASPASGCAYKAWFWTNGDTDKSAVSVRLQGCTLPATPIPATANNGADHVKIFDICYKPVAAGSGDEYLDDTVLAENCAITSNEDTSVEFCDSETPRLFIADAFTTTDAPVSVAASSTARTMNVKLTNRVPLTGITFAYDFHGDFAQFSTACAGGAVTCSTELTNAGCTCTGVIQGGGGHTIDVTVECNDDGIAANAASRNAITLCYKPTNAGTETMGEAIGSFGSAYNSSGDQSIVFSPTTSMGITN